MKTCDICGQQMDEGFIVEIEDPENPHEPDLAEVCEACYEEMERPEPDPMSDSNDDQFVYETYNARTGEYSYQYIPPEGFD